MFKIILIDDHKMLLNGLKMVLEANTDIEVVQIFSNSLEVIPYLNNNNVDLIISDLNMPKMNGIELIEKIKNNFPYTKTAVMTMYYNPHLIELLEGLNIDGYIHKSIDNNDLQCAIQTIRNGEKYYSKVVKKILGNDNFEFAKNLTIVDNFLTKYCLSPRELEIFHLIIENYSSQEIADKLHISKDTVSTHRKNIVRKIGCTTPVEMLKIAIKTGLYE